MLPEAKFSTRVLYVHGLEAGPNGYKARKLREHFEVVAPDMSMSLYNPFAANGVARRWIVRAATLRDASLGGAVFESYHACAEVQRIAIKTHLNQLDVLVGSSWGGAVGSIAFF